MDAVIAEGRVDGNTMHVFAENRLVVIVPDDNPAQLRELASLAGPGLKLVLAAEEVPVGQYTLEFLNKASADSGGFGPDYKTKVLANVVSYEENVCAVLTKVQLGEADAGIVYATDAALPAADGSVQVIDIPTELNVVARYPIAALSGSPNPAAAQRFVAYVLSPAGQVILRKYGFLSFPTRK